eukprot:Opistho-2@25078
MPKFDFEVITMGHGSGGLLTHRLLQSGVFDILKNELLDQQHDGASFELNGRTAFSTDSYVISPIFFPGWQYWRAGSERNRERPGHVWCQCTIPVAGVYY